MKIFLSWSGERSRALALALSDLIPDVLHGLEIWISEHDIAAGARWGTELTKQLEESFFGIICLTPENLNVPWLLFEAGSLAKSVNNSRVVPYRLDLQPSDVPYPLAQFQSVNADEAGTLKLLLSINEIRMDDLTLPEERLKRIFERWWPDLNARLQHISKEAPSITHKRNDRALLEEILDLARSLAENTSSPKIDPLMIMELVSAYADVVEYAADSGVPPSLYTGLKRMQVPLRNLIILASGSTAKRAGKRLAQVTSMLEKEIETYIGAGGVIVPRVARDKG